MLQAPPAAGTIQILVNVEVEGLPQATRFGDLVTFHRSDLGEPGSWLRGNAAREAAYRLTFAVNRRITHEVLQHGECATTWTTTLCDAEGNPRTVASILTLPAVGPAVEAGADGLPDLEADAREPYSKTLTKTFREAFEDIERFSHWTE